MKPERIQRKRTKGWKLPPNTKYVGRPTKWGNLFTDENAVEKYREFILSWYESADTGFMNDLLKLKGKNLACFCPLDKPCHADILLELANR